MHRFEKYVLFDTGEEVAIDERDSGWNTYVQWAAGGYIVQVSMTVEAGQLTLGNNESVIITSYDEYTETVPISHWYLKQAASRRPWRIQGDYNKRAFIAMPNHLCVGKGATLVEEAPPAYRLAQGVLAGLQRHYGTNLQGLYELLPKLDED